MTRRIGSAGRLARKSWPPCSSTVKEHGKCDSPIFICAKQNDDRRRKGVNLLNVLLPFPVEKPSVSRVRQSARKGEKRPGVGPSRRRGLRQTETAKRSKLLNVEAAMNQRTNASQPNETLRNAQKRSPGRHGRGRGSLRTQPPVPARGTTQVQPQSSTQTTGSEAPGGVSTRCPRPGNAHQVD